MNSNELGVTCIHIFLSTVYMFTWIKDSYAAILFSIYFEYLYVCTSISHGYLFQVLEISTFDLGTDMIRNDKPIV